MSRTATILKKISNNNTSSAACSNYTTVVTSKVTFLIRTSLFFWQENVASYFTPSHKNLPLTSHAAHRPLVFWVRCFGAAQRLAGEIVMRFWLEPDSIALLFVLAVLDPSEELFHLLFGGWVLCYWTLHRRWGLPRSFSCLVFCGYNTCHFESHHLPQRYLARLKPPHSEYKRMIVPFEQ